MQSLHACPSLTLLLYNTPPCSAKLADAEKELGSAEGRLAGKAERLRASLQREVDAAQQQVRCIWGPAGCPACYGCYY